MLTSARRTSTRLTLAIFLANTRLLEWADSADIDSVLAFGEGETATGTDSHGDFCARARIGGAQAAAPSTPIRNGNHFRRSGSFIRSISA